MNNQFYTQQQLNVFAKDLHLTFLKLGAEVVEEPYVDHALYGFRAIYIRRYLLQKPSRYQSGILTTLIHVVGLPFGNRGQKMVVLSAPRNIKNEAISDTHKLRIHFDDDGSYRVVHGDQQQQQQQHHQHHHLQPTAKSNDHQARSSVLHSATHSSNLFGNKSNQQPQSESSQQSSQIGLSCNAIEQFVKDLEKYVSHIIEVISPGLVELPTEMKLEILKKLSIESIIRMSQVNNEFRSIIFQHGETLWRHLCLRDFNIKIIDRRMYGSWMELYRDSYIIHKIEICRKERALPGLPERPALPPAPYRLPIEWLPQVLAPPYYPVHDVIEQENGLQLALEMVPLRRVDSLDSIN